MSQIRAELIDHMGDDLRVVNAARVSFDKESSMSFPEMEMLDRDKKLIRYLARHGHWTPFSHPQITLRETVPIFVARQRFKHMVGFTYNEVSRRYVDDEPDIFIPDDWREAPVNAKQGSGDTHYDSKEWMIAYSCRMKGLINLYKEMVADGVAPEQARMVLPQSMMTSYYVTGSLAAFARAYNQRIDPHAQHEIQLLAEQWDNLISPLFPISWEALTQA